MQHNLEQWWWHRLAKVIFIASSLAILGASSFLFYFLKEGDARKYTIIKTFKQYLEENRNNEVVSKFGGRLLAQDSFIEQNDLKMFSLGCRQPDGTVEYLSEFSFKEDVMCDTKTGLACIVPRYICAGEASNIVKYSSEVKYGFSNYFSILWKTLSVFIIWVSLIYLVYYKAVLYIVFGKN